MLEQISDDNATDVTFVSAHSCELNGDEQTWMHNHYMRSIPQYNSLLDEYNAEKARNKRLKSMKFFLQKINGHHLLETSLHLGKNY